MAIDFPASPAVGQRYGFAGINYIFTAQGIWSITNAAAPATSTSKVTIQKFTASATYSPTPGTQFVVVECIGGGGGGGGPGIAGASQQSAASGGGSGGYSRAILTAAQIGASQPVTIGPGGAAGVPSASGLGGGPTSFGSFCLANPGGGGQGGGPGVAGIGGALGGSVSGAIGDVTFAGSPGEAAGYSNSFPNDIALGGAGGSSAFGGGAPTPAGHSTNGIAGGGYGSGGSGGVSSGGNPGTSGGAGSAGICIVTEYNITAAGPQGPAGPMGGTTGVSAPGGRLTLSPTQPVMTATLTAQSTIYYLPYIGDRIPLFDGANMVMTTIPAGLLCAATDTAKNPGAIGANKLNDWFVWNDGGTIRLSHGPDWSNATTRSAGTVLAKINGIWTNAVDITNGPTINKGTYVGTTNSGSDNLFYWVLGTIAPGGGASALFVWNCYNRVDVSTLVGDTVNWTYSAQDYRPANGSVNNRITFIVGILEDAFLASYTVSFGGSSGFNAAMAVGVDSTTVPSGTVGYGLGLATATQTPVANVAAFPLSVGNHFVQAIEWSAGQVISFNGQLVSTGDVVMQSGLTLSFRM